MIQSRRFPRMLVISALLHVSALAVGQWLMPAPESQPVQESEPLQIHYVERARLETRLSPTLDLPEAQTTFTNEAGAEPSSHGFEERAVLERTPRRILSANISTPGETSFGSTVHSLPVAASSMPSLPQRVGIRGRRGTGGNARSIAAVGDGKIGSIDAGSPEGGVHGRLLLHQPMPKYPEVSRKDGHEGEVRFAFRVKADGHLRPKLRLLASSGDSALDRAAGLALRAYRFAPLVGESSYPSDQEGELSFVFRLRTQTARSH